MLAELDQLALQETTKLLSVIQGVQLISDWEPVSQGIAMQTIRLRIVNGSKSNFPSESEWVVVVDFNIDQWGKVQIHPSLGDLGIIATYQHQQFNGAKHPKWPVRNGHICTLTDFHGLAQCKLANHQEPGTTVERIVWHVERALEWVHAANSQTLTKTGDFFELPDYNIGESVVLSTIAFNESHESFESWAGVDEKFGIVSFVEFNNTTILKRFYDKKGKASIIESEWGTAVNALKESGLGLWICLKDVPVTNVWQAPKTMHELCSAIESQGILLSEILALLLKNFGYNGRCILFLGLPVPERIGKEAKVYSWRGLILAPPVDKRTQTTRLPNVLNHLKSDTSVKWFLRSENWNFEELQKRGSFKESIRNAKTLIIGCGALGSSISELLVRMGVVDLTVADSELLEAGNLVRHTLDLACVNISKSIALADRLNKLNPNAKVKYINVVLPSNQPEIKSLMPAFDLVLDVTANDTLLSNLPFADLDSSSLIVSCSLGLHARRLFLYGTSAENFNQVEFNNWFDSYRHEEQKLAEIEDLPRGIGCWHPLTPAPHNRVMGLAGVAVELIEEFYESKHAAPLKVCYDWQVPEIN